MLHASEHSSRFLKKSYGSALILWKFSYELTIDKFLAIQTAQETVTGSKAGKLHCSSISIDSNSIPDEMNGTYTRLLCMEIEMLMCNGY